MFGGANQSNAVYRAYRVPYGWIPQLHDSQRSVA